MVSLLVGVQENSGRDGNTFRVQMASQMFVQRINLFGYPNINLRPEFDSIIYEKHFGTQKFKTNLKNHAPNAADS